MLLILVFLCKTTGKINYFLYKNSVTINITMICVYVLPYIIGSMTAEVRSQDWYLIAQHRISHILVSILGNSKK